jgi:hypothetical protein
MQALVVQSRLSLDLSAQLTGPVLEIPKQYIVCTDDRAISVEGQRLFASAVGAKSIELPCGHSPFLKEKETNQIVGIIAAAAAF